MKRPNILFLMNDQHRYDFTGYEGHVTRTPTMDWLAQTGAHFTNAYTPTPVCVPGRMCMMSGQMPKTCQCETFQSDLTPNYMTFAKRFSQYAYRTVCCGKLHHTGSDQMQGWNWRIGEEMHITDRNIDGRVEEEFEKYKPVPLDGTVLSNSLARSGLGFNPVQLVDDYTHQGALNFIRLFFDSSSQGAEARSTRPVFLKVSLIAPHDPFITCDEDKFNYYMDQVEPYDDDPPLPELLTDRDWPELVKLGRDLDAETARKAHAAYHAMIERTDDIFANVLQALKDAGQDLDDWIIVYTSDHGELLGQHQCWWKFKMYEGCIRVPLLIRAPRYFDGGIRVPQNVNLCDLFATLCDMAEIPAPDGLDSRSLLPLMRGDAAGWNNESLGFGHNRVMIKRDDLKYIFIEDGDREILFDLAADPSETVNVIADPKYEDVLPGFRQRTGELGFGPHADPDYRNAGYTDS